MIDLHSHILPKLCDGSQDLETSIAMAELAVADGITHLACTPHIYPPIYCNHTAGITAAMLKLQQEFEQRDIPLQLIIGADVNMTPEVMMGLKKGTIPTLNHSRYFLLEPSHHNPVSNFIGQIENFLYAGYVPVITHPERLRWVNEKYHEFIQAVQLGAWIQITAGAITGDFGSIAKKNAERFLKDGYVHIIASDAHSIQKRPPILSRGIESAISLINSEAEVLRMVYDRPQAILDNAEPSTVMPALTFQPQSSCLISKRRDYELHRINNTTNLSNFISKFLRINVGK